ncbi:hypothetical protein ACKVMT_03960 [Halobacteriales archaeon Cl-PHB]
MGTAIISRWARRFLLVAGGFLVLSQVSAIAGLPRRTEVILGLLGFVVTVVFGKAYSLVPSYFDRSLSVPRAPMVHLPLAAVGVLGLATRPLSGVPDLAASLGALAWAGGVAVFLGTMAVTLRDNPIGSETGTSEANAKRQRLDRLANGFMPVSLAYLAVGTYALAASVLGLPTVFDGYLPRGLHLIAVGFALLLLFAVGFRLLPRFLSADSPAGLAPVVLPAGAVGPVLIAWGLPNGRLFQAGAALEGIALGGFALAFFVLYHRSDRDRVGFTGPLLGLTAGLVGVGLGVSFAFGTRTVALTTAHLRLNVFGLLGTTIVGVIYQFYPPAVGQWPLTGDDLALASLVGMALGVAGIAFGPLVAGLVTLAGHVVLALAGVALLYQLLAVISRQTG